MFGVGAVAGTLSGGYTNAARPPGDDTVVPRPVVAALSGISTSATPVSDPSEDDAQSGTTTVARTPVAMTAIAPPNETAPAHVIADRFPDQWQRETPRTSSGDGGQPQQALPQTMAYAAEPARAAGSSGFELASVNPAAEPESVPTPMPKRMARPEKPKPQVLFNDAQLASIKARLRLTRDQEHYWPQVEQALRAISWKLATQQNGQRAGRGRQPLAMIDPNSPEVARLKSAAVPLIMSMREDQKQEVRQLAHTMGLRQVASMF
jgi:hypothetical protein